MDWGGTLGPLFPGGLWWPCKEVQGLLLIHELFHRIQPQLGLLVPDLPSDHLDTLEGRYWMQLEWKALSWPFPRRAKHAQRRWETLWRFVPRAGASSPAFGVLVDMDRGKLTVPAPAVVEGKALKGDGWTLAIADGWVIRPGPRAGDFQLVRER